MTRARTSLAIAIAALWACTGAPPRSQARVWIDTDAPVPQLFDRAILTVLDTNLQQACDGCRFEFALSKSNTWPLSIGLLPPGDGTARYLRVTLFPEGRTSGGLPAVPTAIDRIVSLRFGAGIVDQSVFLPIACVARGVNRMSMTSCDASGSPDQPIAPSDQGVQLPSRMGTWNADRVRGPRGPARAERDGLHDGDVAIPGGVFWMGDIRVRGTGPVRDPVPEHVVAVSPFFLDQNEYTVARYRAALAAGFMDVTVVPFAYCPARPADEWDRCLQGGIPPGCGFGFAYQYCCTYMGPHDARNDTLPLNCVSRATAEALCQFEHLRLPTEAEWEWAAGGREHEWLYPWGDSDPGCDDIVGIDTAPLSAGGGMCPNGVHEYPIPVGTTRVDHSFDGVADLADNVAEWVSDDFQQFGAGCWAPTLAVDPRCSGSAPDNPSFGASVRGGSYESFALFRYTAADRWFVTGGERDITVGFRCARDE